MCIFFFKAGGGRTGIPYMPDKVRHVRDGRTLSGMYGGAGHPVHACLVRHVRDAGSEKKPWRTLVKAGFPYVPALSGTYGNRFGPPRICLPLSGHIKENTHTYVCDFLFHAGSAPPGLPGNA